MNLNEWMTETKKLKRACVGLSIQLFFILLHFLIIIIIF